MTPAEQALASAIHCEMVKCAYRQSKDGVVVSLVVHPQEVPEGLATAPLGTRYMVALVPIGDDERPIPPAAKEKSKPDSVSVKPLPDTDKPSAGAKRDWRSLPAPQRAGIRINEPTFAAYLRERHSDEWHETGEADACLKFICKITSKRDLSVNARACQMFDILDNDYQGWLAKERVGV